ncbi:hypothetical protein DFJ73DRAFT_775980 [Zopfochytrium polystomum]|nr:hypothetical protein DFJ73DRAFT_775980 [Zopfochytrium polystomum]
MQQALHANNRPSTIHSPLTGKVQHQPLQTPTVSAVVHQQSPMVNLVFQVAVPAHQLMRSGLAAGAFQLFAPHLSLQTLNHPREVLQLEPSTPTATLRPQKPPSPHSLAHPTPTASPTPPPRRLKPALSTPPSPPPPPGLPTRTPTPPVVTTTTATTRPSTAPPPSRPTTAPKPTPRNTATATRAAAPCPHNRRRSQCIACFELGQGGGSICIHRRRKAGCRLCAAEGRCHSHVDGPRRRIRGPNTYVPPPPPLQQLVAMAATATTTAAEGGKDRVAPRAAARTAMSAFSVEALCGLA